MSSHQMATIEEFCSDITILDRGKTVLQGDLNQIKNLMDELIYLLNLIMIFHPTYQTFNYQFITKPLKDII